MKQILPNVHFITGLPVGRVYVIEDPDGLTVIDASVSGTAGAILSQIKSLGRAPRDVKRILITHAHPDHVGALLELQAQTGAQVIASAIEQPVIEGRQPVTRPDPAKLKGWFKLSLPRTVFKPVKVDRALQGGETIETLGGLQAVFTPGHAPGHLAFWQPEQRVLFCGDVLFNAPKLGLPPDFLTADREQNLRSVGVLAQLSPTVVCFGHGEPLTQNAAPTLQQFARAVGAL
jgi:glyoxylase-like metal-dependent hydrolase (beta-lactamase superfamily II)